MSTRATGALVLKHPCFEEINARLLKGESVQHVSGWLRKKFKNDKRKWISKMTLQAYRQNHLNLTGELLAEIKKERQEVLLQEKRGQQHEIVKASKEYQLAKRKLANDVLDTRSEILRIHDNIWEQIDVLKEAGDTRKLHLVSATVKDLLSEARQLMMDYNKLLDNQEKNTQTSVSINIGSVQDYQKQLKETLLETFREVAPELLPSFLDRLREKLQGNEPAEQIQSIEGQVGPVSIQITQDQSYE